ncbi:MAG: glycosyltransferase family 4 protein [candidate division WOR-3 bacterium]|nr:glycosyltransferase family 4 protein [candidate division WOR-3 bacterium]
MKIGILCLTTPEAGGVHQYSLSAVEALKLLSNDYDIVQIRLETFPKILDKDLVLPINLYKAANLFVKLIRAFDSFFKLEVLDSAIQLAREHLNDFDLLISPIISLFPYHLRKPYVVTIHDFQHKYYPNFFSIKERLTREIIYRTGIHSNMIVVESEFVKKDTVKFLKVDASKIKVIPSPPPTYISRIVLYEDKIPMIINKYHLTGEYLFYPAQFWHHKNHIALLEALKILKERYNLFIPLILCGSKKNNFNNVMKFIESNNLENQVKYLGYVTNEDMPYLYKLSTALVMPTLFESVSLPIWEAFYLGVPVVSSDVCALPEQVGDAGLIFNPNDPEDIAEKIYKIWTDKDLRKILIEKGYKRIKDLTIEKYAEKWRDVIEEVRRSVKK